MKEYLHANSFRFVSILMDLFFVIINLFLVFAFFSFGIDIILILPYMFVFFVGQFLFKKIVFY